MPSRQTNEPQAIVDFAEGLNLEEKKTRNMKYPVDSSGVYISFSECGWSDEFVAAQRVSIEELGRRSRLQIDEIERLSLALSSAKREIECRNGALYVWQGKLKEAMSTIEGLNEEVSKGDELFTNTTLAMRDQELLYQAEIKEKLELIDKLSRENSEFRRALLGVKH